MTTSNQSNNHRKVLSEKLKIELKDKVFDTNKDGKLRILEYRSSSDVDVEFIDTGTKLNVYMGNVYKGEVKDPYRPSVYGKGMLGVGRHSASDNVYYRWNGMLERAYGPKHAVFNVTVCNEWHNFQNYAEWFYAQSNCKMKDFEVDKDVKGRGKRHYSPETCVLVPQAVNALFDTVKGMVHLIEGIGKNKVHIAKVCSKSVCVSGDKAETVTIGAHAKMYHAMGVLDKYREFVDYDMAVESMKWYLTEFCKEHGVEVNLDTIDERAIEAFSKTRDSSKRLNPTIEEGGVYQSRAYGEFLVEKIHGSMDVDIKFVETGFRTKSNSSTLYKGAVKDPYYPGVYGLGHIGEEKVDTRGNAARTWEALIGKCSGSAEPTETTPGICKEWLHRPTFVKWFDAQYRENGWKLYTFSEDKEFYSPTTCAIVPAEVGHVLATIRNKPPISVGKVASGYRTITCGKHVATCKTYEEACVKGLQERLRIYKAEVEKCADKIPATVFVLKLALALKQYAEDNGVYLNVVRKGGSYKDIHLEE